MMVLDKEMLYGSRKKCLFITSEMTLLGYIMVAQGFKVDDECHNCIEYLSIYESF